MAGAASKSDKAGKAEKVSKTIVLQAP